MFILSREKLGIRSFEVARKDSNHIYTFHISLRKLLLVVVEGLQ